MESQNSTLSHRIVESEKLEESCNRRLVFNLVFRLQFINSKKSVVLNQRIVLLNRL